jgi:myo-inositol-1(or 4)-monophosphatase
MEDYKKALKVAKSAARAAGRLLASQSGLEVRSSTAHDTKLEADLTSEVAILDMLSKHYPVLSEEAGGTIAATGPTWIVDPLDGTVNYSRGIPISCVSIALWDKGPVLGVVYDFNRNEMFSGIVGEGAFLNDTEISVSKTVDRADAIMFTGFPAASSFDTEKLAGFVRLVQRYKKVRLLGSAALSLAYVASGRGDAYMEQRIRIWDVAAGVALVNAAGGAFQTLGDDPLDVFADNGVLYGVPDSPQI